MARTLASLGWVVFAVQNPEPDPLPRRWGLRRSLLVRLDGNWDPRRAEAELELAQSLIRQKKWKRAESALEDAIYQFHDQPKLRPRQAGAMMLLGEVRAELGRSEEAFRIYRRAIELDPSRAAEAGSAVAGLLDPVVPLAELAEASAGGIVRSAQELEYLLDDFGSRVRLGFQVEGTGDGAFSELKVTWQGGGFTALAPRWVSHGRPAAVAEARSRRLLADDASVEGDSGRVSLDELPEAFCDFIEEGPRAKLSIQLFPEMPEGWEGLPLRYRVSVSAAAPGGARTRSEIVAVPDWAPGEAWEHQFEIEIDPEEPFVAFVVEEVNSGRWSGSLVECEAGI
jgi:tetratricopeptide (TPR) repeat protein